MGDDELRMKEGRRMKKSDVIVDEASRSSSEASAVCEMRSHAFDGGFCWIGDPKSPFAYLFVRWTTNY